MKHGRGFLSFEEGLSYKGGFAKNLFEGKGVLELPD